MKSKTAILALSLSVLSACAHTQGRGNRAGDSNSDPRTVGQVLSQSQDNSSNGQGPGPGMKAYPGDLIVQGIKLQNTQFDYPITLNSRVEYWVDYFTGRGRKHFERYLERSEFFVPYIRPLLKQNGVPEDLVYLAMIESGFNNHARSHAKAVGPWQFISATGKRYGLTVNWWVDERRDTRKSTIAAIEYLKELHGMFQSWELAAAAYNAGESKVARAIRRYGSKDFWTIARQRYLRPETRDYVPKIIAAALVSKNRTQFGFAPPKAEPHEGEALAGDGELVRVIKDSDEPSPVAQGQIPTSAKDSISKILSEEVSEDPFEEGDEASVIPATLTLPESGPMPGQLVNSGESIPQAKPIPMPHVSKKGEVIGEEMAEFEVQSPADLLKVARAAGLSYQTVKSLNPELLRWCTPPNVSTYRLKLPVSTKDKFLTAYNRSDFPRKVQFLSYRVQKGETLSNVARRFGIRVDPVSDLNGVSARMPLRKGIRILLPMPEDRSRSLASLEVRDPPEVRRGRRKAKGNRYYKVTYKRREAARARSNRSNYID